MENIYIVKSGHSLATAKGIVGPPIDPENPTQKEFITEKHFGNGKKGLANMLEHDKCPIIKFEKKENDIVKHSTEIKGVEKKSIINSEKKAPFEKTKGPEKK